MVLARLIADLFRRHFFHHYKSKGASRLPVLALFAVYRVLIEQVARYQGMRLRPLEEHSAADSQTNSVGDIEIILLTADRAIKHEHLEVWNNLGKF